MVQISAALNSTFLIIGHRGFRAKYPENTLSGFKAAILSGVSMIELDVQLSSDGHLVVIHDDDVDRTTNGKGPVTSHTLAELKKLDAGTWFDARFKNEPIPTLEEVLDIVGDKSLINIEIKVKPNQRVEVLGNIEKITLALIRRKNIEKQVLVSSFNKKILESIRQTNPTVALGVLTEFGEETDIITLCKSLNAVSWHPYYLALEPEKVALMHQHGIKVIPYTVNSREDIKQLSEMGADGVFTDDPVAARTLTARKINPNIVLIAKPFPVFRVV